MSHSPVRNTNVSTKKTRLTLEKYVRKLRVTLHACKGTVPVSVKDKCATRGMCVRASNEAWVWVCVYVPVILLYSPVDSCLCVYVREALPKVRRRGAPRDVYMFVHAIKRGMGLRMCVSFSTKSSVNSYLCMYVMEAHMEVARRTALRDMCVCVWAREIKGGYGCVYVCYCRTHSPIDSYLCAYVCICKLTTLNDCNLIKKWLQLGIQNSLVITHINKYSTNSNFISK